MMIDNYEIKNNNNNDVLYLYIDIDFEFGKLSKNNKLDLKRTIVKYIKDNNINFKKGLVALVISGTIIKTITLNNVDFKENFIHDNLVADALTYEKYNDINNGEVSDNNYLQEIVDNVSSDSKIDNSYDKITKEDNTYMEVNNTKNVDNNMNKDDNESKVVDNKQYNDNNSDDDNNVINEEDNNIYINVNRSNGDIQRIELEEYVIGVLGAEMPAAFHSEALKAGAIIARTYALKANFKGNVLKDNESSQSYKTNDELRSIWGSSFDVYYNKIKNAVNDTEGMYLTYNGSYIEAVYHSTSNGFTESSVNVWGNYYPYLVTVDSPYDNTNSSFQKEKNISFDELSTILGMEINKDTEFNIISKTEGNRVQYISVDNKTYKGTDFRNMLGLRSADFDISINDSDVTFTTRGYGHGVGLSQYGANGMAKNGYSYREILNHYYPGTTLTS